MPSQNVLASLLKKVFSFSVKEQFFFIQQCTFFSSSPGTSCWNYMLEMVSFFIFVSFTIIKSNKSAVLSCFPQCASKIIFFILASLANIPTECYLDLSHTTRCSVNFFPDKRFSWCWKASYRNVPLDCCGAQFKAMLYLLQYLMAFVDEPGKATAFSMSPYTIYDRWDLVFLSLSGIFNFHLQF